MIHSIHHLLCRYILIPGAIVLFLLLPLLQSAPLTPDKKIKVVNQEQTDPQWKKRWDEARRLSQQGEIKRAIRQYLEVIAEKPHIEEVRWELSKSYVAERDYSEALLLLEGLIEAAPEKIVYLVSGGEVALAMGKIDMAAKLFGQALALEPGGPLSDDALLGMIEALKIQGKNELTLPLMEQLYQRGLLGADLLIDLARNYEAVGAAQRSAYFYQELVRKFRVDPETRLEAAAVFEEAELAALAAEQREAYLESNPDHVPTRIRLADYYSDQGDIYRALPHMQELIDRQIGRETYLLAVARIYLYNLGRADRALNYYEQYQAEFPQKVDVSSEIATLQLMLANDLLAIVENDGVWRLWRDLARVTPNRIGIYRAMADMLEEKGPSKERELIEVLKIINVHEPEDLGIVTRIAELYLEDTRYRDCLSFLDGVDGKISGQAAYLLLRADCEAGAGLELERLISYTAYLDVKPGDQQVRSRAIALAGIMGLVEQMNTLYDNRTEKKTLSAAGVEIAFLHGLVHNSLSSEALQSTRVLVESKLVQEAQAGLFQDLAAELRRQNHLFEAEQLLRTFAARYPENPDSYLLLAEHFLQRSDPRNAKLWMAPVLQDQSTGSAVEELSPEQKSRLFYLDLLLDDLTGGADVQNRAMKYLDDRAGSTQTVAEDVEVLLFVARQQLLANNHFQSARLLNRFAHAFKADDRIAGLLFIADQESAGGAAADPVAFESLSYVTRFSVVEQLIELRRYTEAYRLAAALLTSLQESTRARSMQALAGALTYHLQEAYELYAGLTHDFPEESWFREQMLNMENLRGQPQTIFSIFSVAADETGRKNRITNSLESMNYPKAKLMWARALWAADKWEEALDVYGLLDTELKREIDRFIEVIQNDPALLQKLPQPAAEAELVDLIMSSAFVAQNLDDGINVISADYYQAYRWSTIVEKERTAKSSLKAREFYQAELDYQELFEEEGSVIEENYPDLVTLYGRLGRHKQETEVLETIQERSIFYPSLSGASEKSIRRQRPFLSLDGRYKEEDGRDGFKNITKKYGGVGLQIKPTIYQEIGLAAGRSEYGDSFASTLAKSNLIVADYGIEFTDNFQGEFQLGFEDFDTDGKSFLIYDVTLKGKLEQRVELLGSIKQVPVDDTIDALLSGIYRKDVQFGLTLDYLFGMFFGFDLSFFDYNDKNKGQQYHLWGAYRWFGERSSFDFTYSYLNIQDEISNESFGDINEARAAGGPLYWSPGDYWNHRLSAYYKLELWPTGRLQSGTSSLSALYAIGFEDNDNLVHELEANILLEINQPFLVKGTVSTLISDDYENFNGYISLVYRW